MEFTTMICDCCGKQFYSKYHEGGYIDHTNFSRNLHILVKKEVEDIVYEICRSGNDIRDDYSLKDQLNCFCKYCDKHNLQELKETVCKEVGKFNERKRQLDEIHDKIVDIVKECDGAERDYIGLRYQAFDYYRIKKEKQND